MIKKIVLSVFIISVLAFPVYASIRGSPCNPSFGCGANIVDGQDYRCTNVNNQGWTWKKFGKPACTFDRVGWTSACGEYDDYRIWKCDGSKWIEQFTKPTCQQKCADYTYKQCSNDPNTYGIGEGYGCANGNCYYNIDVFTDTQCSGDKPYCRCWEVDKNCEDCESSCTENGCIETQWHAHNICVNTSYQGWQCLVEFLPYPSEDNCSTDADCQPYPENCNNICISQGYDSGYCDTEGVFLGAPPVCESGEVDIGWTQDCYVPSGMVGINRGCCCKSESEISIENCYNAIDDDGDGLADCLDPDCNMDCLCSLDAATSCTGQDMCHIMQHNNELPAGNLASCDLNKDGVIIDIDEWGICKNNFVGCLEGYPGDPYPCDEGEICVKSCTWGLVGGGDFDIGECVYGGTTEDSSNTINSIYTPKISLFFWLTNIIRTIWF